MSDLIEQLQQGKACRENSETVMRKAADEIERLTAENECLSDSCKSAAKKIERLTKETKNQREVLGAIDTYQSDKIQQLTAVKDAVLAVKADRQTFIPYTVRTRLEKALAAVDKGDT